MPLSNLGKAALDWAEQGFFIFPCIPGEKTSIIKQHFILSSREPEQIRAWWTENPYANIGLDCGKSGVAVIDVDPKNGGDKALPGLKFITGGRKAWNTRVHRSPSGGEHYLFAAPTEGPLEPRTGSGRFGGRGIDCKAKGGHVVLPPSRLLNGSYEVINDVPILPVPRRLLFPVVTERDSAGRTELEARLQDGVRFGPGARNDFLHAVAGRLARIGFTFEERLALVRESYTLRCVPDDSFTEEELIHLVRSADRYAAQETLLEDLERSLDIPGEWNDNDQATAINLMTFLNESTDETEWVAEGLLQTTSLNMLMGGPKSGKSTVARRLIMDVAFGRPFLGRFATKQSPVLFYSLQENKAHLKGWCNDVLKTLGNPNVAPIDVVFRLGKRGSKAIDGLRERCLLNRYGLIVIDMFGRFSGLRSLDDYAEVETLLDYLKDVADQTGACVLWLHHERKAGGEFEGGIGSQAIRGAVYTTLKTWKEKGAYFIASEQRDGDDLPSTSIILDPKTQTMRTGGGRLAAAVNEQHKLRAKIEAALKKHPNATIRQIRLEVGGRAKTVADIIREIKKVKVLSD